MSRYMLIRDCWLNAYYLLTGSVSPQLPQSSYPNEAMNPAIANASSSMIHLLPPQSPTPSPTK